MRVGIRDASFLPHHGTLLTSQLQAKFLRSRLGSALSSRDDMQTLRRELQFRQQHDSGPIGRFRNVRSAHQTLTFRFTFSRPFLFWSTIAVRPRWLPAFSL